jgi:phosphopantetheinyl transferase (holo-ACP synthase)
MDMRRSEDADDDDGVLAEDVEVISIAEVGPLLAGGGRGPFTEGELAYARDKCDPERRLAARLAAKRAAVRLLGGAVAETDVEIVRGRGGPPRLRLSPRAEEQLRRRGAAAALVSLTHGREHAAAAVLLVRGSA